MAFPLIVDRDHAGWKRRNATPGRRPSGAPHAASVPTVRSARRLALVSVVEPGMRSLRTRVSNMRPFPKRAWQRSIQRRPAHRRRQLDRAGSQQGLLNVAEAGWSGDNGVFFDTTPSLYETVRLGRAQAVVAARDSAWGGFDGSIKPKDCETARNELRLNYQGGRPPVTPGRRVRPRGEVSR